MKNKTVDKKPQTENARGQYNDRLAVKGTFLDIMKAAVKDANSKTAEKKKNEPKP